MILFLSMGTRLSMMSTCCSRMLVEWLVTDYFCGPSAGTLGMDYSDYSLLLLWVS